MVKGWQNNLLYIVISNKWVNAIVSVIGIYVLLQVLSPKKTLLDSLINLFSSLAIVSLSYTIIRAYEFFLKIHRAMSTSNSKQELSQKIKKLFAELHPRYLVKNPWSLLLLTTYFLVVLLNEAKQEKSISDSFSTHMIHSFMNRPLIFLTTPITIFYTTYQLIKTRWHRYTTKTQNNPIPVDNPTTPPDLTTLAAAPAVTYYYDDYRDEIAGSLQQVSIMVSGEVVHYPRPSSRNQ